jgi:hypothetical protein
MEVTETFAERINELYKTVHRFTKHRPRETVIGVLFYEADLILKRVRDKINEMGY